MQQMEQKESKGKNKLKKINFKKETIIKEDGRKLYIYSFYLHEKDMEKSS
jgi:hypothetical protein